MDKTLDLDELERVAKRATQARRYRVGPKVYARGHGVPLLTVNDLGPSLGQQDEDATYIATFDPPTILTLIAAARPAVVSDEVVSTLTKAFWAEYAKSDRGTTAMRAALALLPGGVPDREAIARVIWDTWVREAEIGTTWADAPLYAPEDARCVMACAEKVLALLSPGEGEGEGSSRSLPSRTAQEPPSPTPCDLEGEKRLHEMTPEEFAAYSRTLGDA